MYMLAVSVECGAVTHCALLPDDCTLLEIGMGLITGIDGLMAQLINNRVNAASQMFN